MLETSFSILFYVRKPKGYTSGKIPVYLRITVNGIRKEIGTKQVCEPSRWNPNSQRANGSTEVIKTLNAYLDALERRVQEARLKLLETNKTITVEMVMNRFLGIEEKPRMLLEVFQQHNDQLAALENKDYAPATVKRYATTLEHTRAFINWKYQKNDIEIAALSFDFVSQFEFWLKSVRKCNHNSAIKYIGNMRKIVNYCMKTGWLPKDPFFGFKMAKKEVVREYLSEDELRGLSDKTFAIDRLSQVRDIFLFSCYTGLAFVDVFQLTPSRITKGIDGNQWIFTFRQKTDTPTRIPLLPQAQTILNKYKDHPRCINEGKVLPVLSNQKMNAYLKEIADLCGITKILTFHIARHTFATTVTLNNDVPIESVSKMLGHKSIKITQHYAKIIDKKVSADMLVLQTRLAQQSITNHAVEA
jgi:site-specific recombinase XerD